MKPKKRPPVREHRGPMIQERTNNMNKNISHAIPMKVEQVSDWYVDGHCIHAESAIDAAGWARLLYGHKASIVRPWAQEDAA